MGIFTPAEVLFLGGNTVIFNLIANKVLVITI